MRWKPCVRRKRPRIGKLRGFKRSLQSLLTRSPTPEKLLHPSGDSSGCGPWDARVECAAMTRQTNEIRLLPSERGVRERAENRWNVMAVYMYY